MKQLEQVNEFMRVMGQEMPEQPCIPDIAIINLKAGLLQEETYELVEAALEGDIIEVADALCDILYVTLGAFTAYGFNAALMDELFDEVHASNMSKLCYTEPEVQETQLAYSNSDIATTITKAGEYWVVARASDNKVLKSVNFREPNLKAILARHGVL